MFVAVLFFRLISNASVNRSDATTIGNGLAQLQQNRGGRACLFILGFFLIVYGLFAVSLLLVMCVSDTRCSMEHAHMHPFTYSRKCHHGVHYPQPFGSR